MEKFLTKEWRGFGKRLLIATASGTILAGLFAFGERTGYYWVPLMFIGVLFLGGADVLIDRRILKKSLIPMLAWTVRWDVPLVFGLTIATLIIGVQVEEIIIFALLKALAVCVTMTLGMLRRRKRITALINTPASDR